MSNTNNYELKEWNEIKDQFADATLILGNGSSIALHEGFNYKKLKELATMEKLFEDENIVKLFDNFDNKQNGNFELILEYLWHTKIINECLGFENNLIEKTYSDIRNALIKSVNAIHCDYTKIQLIVDDLYKFTSQFKTILSLNYDLILYWLVMYGNKEKKDKHEFRDGWIYQNFKADTEFLRNPSNGIDKVTLVFYPHGNLIFFKNKYGQEMKLEKREKGDTEVFERIVLKWNRDNIPLFICEGYQSEKEKQILRSPYLSFVYKEVIPNIFNYNSNLVIYGWSLSESDDHILKALLEKCKKTDISIAISTRRESFDKNKHCFVTRLKKYKRNLTIIFFDSESSGCWNNP